VKSTFNIILTVVVAAIVYLCIATILVPIRFNRAKSVRDRVVVDQLELIRSAQLEYSKQHGGQYCASWTDLISFIKGAKLPRLVKDTIQNEVDTAWVSMLDSVFPSRYNVDSIKYVPYGRGVTFEMLTKTLTVSRDTKIYLLQVQTPYYVYLQGLDTEEIKELENLQNSKKKYAGLKIGDLDHPNTLEGNWEMNNKQ
jgi:type II secretory pathway pseudopilin PulG